MHYVKSCLKSALLEKSQEVIMKTKLSDRRGQVLRHEPRTAAGDAAKATVHTAHKAPEVQG